MRGLGSLLRVLVVLSLIVGFAQGVQDPGQAMEVLSGVWSAAETAAEALTAGLSKGGG